MFNGVFLKLLPWLYQWPTNITWIKQIRYTRYDSVSGYIIVLVICLCNTYLAFLCSVLCCYSRILNYCVYFYRHMRTWWAQNTNNRQHKLLIFREEALKTVFNRVSILFPKVSWCIDVEQQASITVVVVLLVYFVDAGPMDYYILLIGYFSWHYRYF